MNIKIGILGSGYMAREHLKVFRNFKQFEIIGIVGRGKRNINKTKKEFSKIEFFSSLKKLFAKSKIDLLIVCINEDQVIKNYKEILNFKCTFLFEKPIGINFSETKKIFQYSQEKNKNVFVSLNRRFYCSTILAINLFNKVKNNYPKTIFINDSQDMKRIIKMGLSRKLAKNLMYTNSVHLIDYATMFIKDKIISIKNIIKFDKKNPKDVLSYVEFLNNHKLIYKANWQENEKWMVNVFSEKININFKPLEKIKILYPKKIKFKNNYDYVDRIFKPGLYNQALEIIDYFNKKKNNLISFNEYFKKC